MKSTEQTTPRERLEAARAAKVAKRERGEFVGTRTPLERLWDNPKSYRLAVLAKCYDCQGQNADPCWQWRVGNCSITGCGLHAVRPHQRYAGKPVPPALRIASIDSLASAPGDNPRGKDLL